MIEEGKMDVTAINKGDHVHTVWEDDTPGNSISFIKEMVLILIPLQ